MSKSVLLVGLRPDVVDYSKWPDLTPQKLQAGLDKSVEVLQEEGFDAKWCLTDTGKTAEQVVRDKLSLEKFDVILVGAGVRTDAVHLVLFETILNAAIELAPGCKIAFNTSPFDTADAVKRWA